MNEIRKIASHQQGLPVPVQTNLVTTETSMPLVSVIVGNHNQKEFVADAIRSVAAQSYSNLECVVVDSGSTDGSCEIITECLTELSDPRFRFIRRDENGGQTATVMAGFSETSGQFVAFVDADDLWLPTFLHRHVSAHLSRTESAAVSASDTGIVDGKGAIIAGGNPIFRTNDLSFGRPWAVIKASEPDDGVMIDFVSPCMATWLWSPTSALVFRRTAIKDLWPQDPGKVRLGVDNYLAVLAHLFGGTVRINASLGYYRLHGNNNWINIEFSGSFSGMHFAQPSVIDGIRSETVKTLCALARDPSNLVNKRYISRALFDYLGAFETLRRSAENPDIHELASEYVSPTRRALITITRFLPKALRPRRYRPRWPF